MEASGRSRARASLLADRVRATSVGAVSALMLFVGASPAPAQVLVDHGSPMVYLDNSADPGFVGVEWTEPDFDSSTWAEGHYGVGYDWFNFAWSILSTFVPQTSRSVYTRATFTIDDPAAIESLKLAVDYDDGVVAWINGVEVYRSPEVPAGDLSWDTTPQSHESSNAPDPFFGTPVDISADGLPALEPGANVLAIGVWDEAPFTSDLVLVPRLYANNPAAFVTRGPYLQLGTHDSIVVRWHTDTNTKGKLSYGTSPSDLDQSLSQPQNKKEHEFVVTGLEPDTTYYYAVGTTSEILLGGDTEHHFRTAPLPGTRRPIRIWVVGDSGTPNAEAAWVRDAYEEFTDGAHTDLWLMLGDNAYDYGTQDEHEGAVFNTFMHMLKRSVLWPTIGNHDAESAFANTPGNESGVYYDIFNLPAAAEAGGVASGTEAYYSFDFGNIHFVVLNSEDVDRSPAGAMVSWLEADLISTAQDWIIAYWHHPPYSFGSHNSDNADGSEFELVEMREWAVPVLEDWGVDLVLTGHSHTYERSFLLDGHYGYSESLTEEMILDDGDGRVTGDGAYQKASQAPVGREGAVYLVAGNASSVDTETLGHPAMAVSLLELGSVVLDVDGDRLEAIFIDEEGAVQDTFTMVQNTATPPAADFSGEPLVGTAPLAVSFTDLSSTNTAAWAWDFDGDGLIDSELRHPEQVFDMPGLYEVRLTASNDSGSDQEIKVGYVCASGTPDVVTELTMTDVNTLTWIAAAGASFYDVIKGSLAVLVDGDGDFENSLVACLADGADALEAADPDDPPPGGAYYLVRALSCADDVGTYDSGGPGQHGPRDAGIESSSQTCP